jgi:hypothetical protein
LQKPKRRLPAVKWELDARTGRSCAHDAERRALGPPASATAVIHGQHERQDASQLARDRKGNRQEKLTRTWFKEASDEE